MSNFEEYVSQTILFETGGDKSGAYHCDPKDKGGETKFGISKNTHEEVDIKKLTYKRAISIYKKDYYHPLYEEIKSKRIAFKVFDLGVLMGPKRPVQALQRSLKDILKIRLKVDGKYGPLTHAAICMATPTQERAIYGILVKRLGDRLGWLALKPGNGKFLIGWLKRVNYMYKDSK